ncbi:Lpp/OprI family alanine-zipper lipoprotein [Halomonas sp. WWR20]
MSTPIKTTLKLSAIGLSMAIFAGCAASGGEKTSQQDQQAAQSTETRNMAREALNTANQAQRDAQAAMQAAQRNREEMDRMFQSSMRK